MRGQQTIACGLHPAPQSVSRNKVLLVHCPGFYSVLSMAHFQLQGQSCLTLRETVGPAEKVPAPDPLHPTEYLFAPLRDGVLRTRHALRGLVSRSDHPAGSLASGARWCWKAIHVLWDRLTGLEFLLGQLLGPSWAKLINFSAPTLLSHRALCRLRWGDTHKHTGSAYWASPKKASSFWHSSRSLMLPNHRQLWLPKEKLVSDYTVCW